MNSKTLRELPRELDKNGWPWKLESVDFPPVEEGALWPRITVVTPSYNQSKYIEETIRSVLLQGYPNLQYIIIDGGSTDGSQEIIHSYEPWLNYWVSESDQGQTDALNKGFAKADGEWMAWLNSDDLYLPNSLFHVAHASLANPDAEWIVGRTVTFQGSAEEFQQPVESKSENLSLRYLTNTWLDIACKRTSGIGIDQPSAFWSRRAWSTTGSLDETLHFTMDYEYWTRLARKGYMPLSLGRTIALYRSHQATKTAQGKISFLKENIRIIEQLIDATDKGEKRTLEEYHHWLTSRLRYLKLRDVAARLPGAYYLKNRLGS